MTQYTNCADPSESAARKERMRQAEAQGDFEESAVQIVKTNLARASEETVPITSDPISQERFPISARLGPTNRVSDPTERTPIFARLGPVNDDQMELEQVCNLEVVVVSIGPFPTLRHLPAGSSPDPGRRDRRRSERSPEYVSPKLIWRPVNRSAALPLLQEHWR
ncbi:hypothetical protein F2Q70_00019352 [Brassica cretica]|uniref:Uncharacterized protein n=1 Tax=Brassica cretica TaxID=69181 RepID=A0A8S9GJH1_BRACR|nr:hypothetical protein F2Q70_00019352 [Brassica cretica]